MGISATGYLEALQALLPTGVAWPRDPESLLTQLLACCSQELARVDSAVEQMHLEAQPALTSDLLPDWERVAGLTPGDLSNEQRRLALIQRLADSGGQSRQHFIDQAAAIGVTIVIEEFPPTACNSICVGALNPPLARLANCQSACNTMLRREGWRFVWLVRQVSDPLPEVGEAACNMSCLEPLKSWGNVQLEHLIRRACPAHTYVLFAYGEV